MSKLALATATVSSCVAFTLAITASWAQQSAPVSDPSTEEIVVTGQRSEQAMRTFVSQMDAAPGEDSQLARWDRKICPSIAGLRPRYAQFLIDRMAQRAFNVDLDVGGPGCKANILIIISPDPDAVARELAQSHPRAMGILNERGRRTLGRQALANFIDSNAPVRWWHVSRVVTRDGEPIAEPAQSNPDSQSRGAPVTLITGNASLLSRTRRQDFGSAFIIVDASQLAQIDFDWGALADYLAMVSLSQLDPAADVRGYPTILNLFSEPTAASPRPIGLTDWDLAYMRGLYEATRDARNVQQQEGEISRRMQRELTPPR